MSKVVRERLQQTIQCMEEATQVIEKKCSNVQQDKALEKQLLTEFLTEVQDLAIAFGTRIEQLRGIGTRTVTELESYCECLFHVSECMDSLQLSDAIKELIRQMEQIKAAFEQDFPDKKEMVFLPYKASMWDSLESVWKAADADPECEAYVIPIPYYDKNPDGTLGTLHYEGDLYPDYVPIMDYKKYDFEVRRPDAVFIHNPYDAANVVTSVDPFYYSSNLKKYTECLVYIPYYATSGDMAEGQALCPAYLYADYIVIQHESYREFFDERIPDEKFLAFGSPKFDRIIHMCQNPPEIPDEWKKTIKGKKVYFYNTSIGGMLENTESFLKKMAYVFQQFENRKDACILWRPHPLLESTFASMRKEYLAEYKALKQKFIDEKLGIYDDTPSIENSIVLSDAYIGDAGSSVTSLFGVVGKPMFILNNRIHRLPEKDDWKGNVYCVPREDGQNQYIVVYGNQLFYSPNNDYKYEFYCNLPEYSGSGYYNKAFWNNGKIYVFPCNAESVLIVQDRKIIRELQFEHKSERGFAFRDAIRVDDYVFLLPGKYPSLIRFDLKTDDYRMIDGVGSFQSGYYNGSWMQSGVCLNHGMIHMLSFDGSKLLSIDVSTMEFDVTDLGLSQNYAAMCPENFGREIYWLLPREGTVVVRLDRTTGETKLYDLKIEGLKALRPLNDELCDESYFSSIAEHNGWVYFAPAYGNKFVVLNPKTGEKKEWKAPFASLNRKNGYYNIWSHGSFLGDYKKPAHWRYFNIHERKTYDVDFDSGEVRECSICFDKHNVKAHARGFGVDSQTIRYCCREDAFHSIRDFLDGTLCGTPFDREKQLAEFSKINASVRGDCGEKVYQFIRKRIEES